MPSAHKIWLDCDPGRDDAVAILLALHIPEIELVGISSVHGNSTIEAMTYNAVRLLCSFGSPAQSASIPVAKGTSVPLVRHLASSSSIHGADGLGGVEGLLDMTDEKVKNKLEEALKTNSVTAIADACKSLKEGEKMVLVGTGAYTNIALFLSVFPELAKEKLESVVLMGGAEGRGNKSPVAEANAYCDPHATAIIFDFDIKVVIAPLNLTHQALFTPEVHNQLLQPGSTFDPSVPLPRASTRLRHALSTNMIFFAQAYKSKYGFPGPPLHDALTIAYIAYPDLFKGKRYRVDVVTEGIAAGATVVDLWEYQRATIDQSEDNWGRNGKNVFVLETLEVQTFWKLFLETVGKADEVCPISKMEF
ncbi:uridine nucleosidase [Meredithblackwellia eburnea MCA 4105]